jgi:hypothetical protein
MTPAITLEELLAWSDEASNRLAASVNPQCAGVRPPQRIEEKELGATVTQTVTYRWNAET